MSMRISNGGESNFVESTRSGAAKSTSLDSKNSFDLNSGFDADQVNLSNASSLVSVAKSFVSPDKSAKLAALSAQVAAGTYRPDASEVGKAVIGSYTKSR